MQSTASLEQTLLDHLRQLSPEKQQEVLDFAEFLRQKLLLLPTSATKPSLQQLASLPLAQRHRLLAPLIADTAEDFTTDPALSPFSAVDNNDWDFLDELKGNMLCKRDLKRNFLPAMPRTF